MTKLSLHRLFSEKKDFISVLSRYRQSGKTKCLLEKASEMDAILVVNSHDKAKRVRKMAVEMHYLNMRHRIITYSDLYNPHTFRGRTDKFLIDDMDLFIRFVLEKLSVLGNFAGFSMGLSPTTEYLTPYLSYVPSDICIPADQENRLCDKRENNSWITVREVGVQGVEETRYVDVNGKILGYVQPTSVFVNRDDTKWRAYIWTDKYTCIGEYINKQSAMLGIIKYRKNQ